jgi:hypothetical protein
VADFSDDEEEFSSNDEGEAEGSDSEPMLEDAMGRRARKTARTKIPANARVMFSLYFAVTVSKSRRRKVKQFVSMLVFWVVRQCGLVGRYQHFGGTYASMTMLFWVLTPCRLVITYQRFGETYCLHLQGGSTSLHSIKTQNIILSAMRTSNLAYCLHLQVSLFCQNVGIYLQDHMALQPQKTNISIFTAVRTSYLMSGIPDSHHCWEFTLSCMPPLLALSLPLFLLE